MRRFLFHWRCIVAPPATAQTSRPPPRRLLPSRARRVGPRRRLHHRRAGRARLSLVVPRRAVAAGPCPSRSTIILRPIRSPGSSRRGNCCARRRRGRTAAAIRSKSRRPPMAAYRPDPALHPRLRRSRTSGRSSRSRSIATRRSTCAPAERPRARTSTRFGDRHRPAAADHARGADGTLCAIHSEHGAANNAGLGFYTYLRFHIDAPNSAAGTWTRRSPPNARRSIIPGLPTVAREPLFVTVQPSVVPAPQPTGPQPMPLPSGGRAAAPPTRPTRSRRSDIRRLCCP